MADSTQLQAQSDISAFAANVLRQEAQGISNLVGILDEHFISAVTLLLRCSGHVVVTGVGKPWLIGQKISATLASTGTPSFALHPSEAVHGDVGRLREHDVVLAMSNSGTSEEVLRLLPVVKRIGCKIIAVTGAMDSPLARIADVTLNMGKIDEACPIGMAPSVSTTVMLALGDAIALSVMKSRNFGREDYAKFHPGGALGRSLMKVSEVKQALRETARVDLSANVADALKEITLHKAGCVFVTDNHRVVGVFTDGDLRRHIQNTNLLNLPITDVMTQGGKSISSESLVTEAVQLMQKHRIGELPVVGDDSKIEGQVVLKDLLAMHFI